MRILYYNWVDYGDDEKRGGGVTVYQRNLMSHIEQSTGLDAMMLSSGISYDIKPGPPRWEPVRHGAEEGRDKRLEIVNSGTLSPSHYSFGIPSQISHPATEDCFARVVEETGPYDVIHFNNLEGLPANVLQVKERFPHIRIVLSWHNYYPVCPQVNLWFQEREHCEDFAEGRKCQICLMGQPEPRLVRLAHATAYRLKRLGVKPGTRTFEHAFRRTLRAGKYAARMARKAAGVTRSWPAHDNSEHFRNRRARMVELINQHVDVVHCVSERTAEIAARYGVEPGKIAIRYIGTRHAAKWDETSPKELPATDTLKLLFLGYMRRDKGFFFMLDALEALPTELAAKIDLHIAAMGGNQQIYQRLEALKLHLGNVSWQNGYKPEEMDQLCADRDVGVVPVLWEDNLPQVALEMHARHMPLLVADRGGAQELAHAPEFVYRSGDAEDFADKLGDLVAGKANMEAYWYNARAPRSVELHLNEILELYREEEAAAAQ